MPVKLVSTTNFVCKCCPAYNFSSTNVSEYFNECLIFLVVLFTLCYLSLRFYTLPTQRVNVRPNILVPLPPPVRSIRHTPPLGVIFYFNSFKKYFSQIDRRGNLFHFWT
jgi:hypothetical protein